MSTVSTEHLRSQILDAAQRCFVRNGLHGTSMEDVAAESGLPAETVSRHFETRDDLVGGIAANILRLISGFFEEIRREDPVRPLDEIIERFANTVIAFSGQDGPGRLTPIYWASALYNAEMAERARPPIEQGRSGWVEIAERERAAGRLAPDADPKAVGAMLACLMPGILLQHMLLDDVDAATFRSGVVGLLGAKA
ncbi:MAG TPA: TetR/AcrR family transcriptional regulator [Streptosporangiaceae bacterium]|jgi:AcrR family transcriptional regulator